MRVAMIGDYPPPGRCVSGGVERVIDTLASELTRSLAVTVVVPNSAEAATERVHGFEVVHLRRLPLPGVLRYWTFEALALSRAVGRLRADIVHIHGPAGWGMWMKTPCLVTVHGIPHRDINFSRGRRFRWIKAAMMKLLERLARRYCGNIIVINDYVLDELPDVSALPHQLIRNPVDPRFLAAPRQSAAGAERRLVTVGTVCPRKNALGILQLFAALAKTDPTVTLAVCGDVTDRAYGDACLRFIAAQGLSGRVALFGNLGMDDLVREYDRSSLLLILSHQETAPMVAAEALVRGLPIAAPPTFGLKNMIVHGVNGIHLKSSTEAGRALEIVAALDRRFDRNAIAAEAAQLYAPERVAALTLDFYHRVLTHRRSSRGNGVSQ
jgi:glycosyltransferase involved in cell wall biosynthesis